MDLLECSEIVIGLTLEGKIDPEQLVPLHFHQSYVDAAKLLMARVTPAELVDKVGVNKIGIARTAIKEIDQQHDWLAQLERAHNLDEIAGVLEREVKRMRLGEEPDRGKLLAYIQEDGSRSSRFMSMDKVEALTDEEIWARTGYEPVDLHLGGLPKASLTIIAGPPGTGKTSLVLRILSSLLMQESESDEKVVFFSFEMTMKQVKKRLLEIQEIPDEVQARFLTCEDVMNVNEVYAEASRICAREKVKAIALDFADLMATEEDTEQAVGMIYRKCATMAKRTGVPVILLSQLNRNYVSGIPRIHNIRWSGLAEAMAALIMLLYNPNQIWADQGQDKRLPVLDNTGYIIYGKSRFGYKEGGVGAAQVPWVGENGWGEETNGWYSLGNVS